MYIFTKDGLVAIAAYRPDMQNAEGWLDNPVRRRLHESAVDGEDTFVIRGWHSMLIADVLRKGTTLGIDQSVFFDDKADYPYRALVPGGDMPRVFKYLMGRVDYHSLKASVSDEPMWDGLNAVHQTAKQSFDSRFSYLNAKSVIEID